MSSKFNNFCNDLKSLFFTWSIFHRQIFPQRKMIVIVYFTFLNQRSQFSLFFFDFLVFYFTALQSTGDKNEAKENFEFDASLSLTDNSYGSKYTTRETYNNDDDVSPLLYRGENHLLEIFRNLYDKSEISYALGRHPFKK